MKNDEIDTKESVKICDNLHKQMLRMRPVVAAAIKICCIEFDKVSQKTIEKNISSSAYLTSLNSAVGSYAAGENCEVCDDGTDTKFDSLFVVKHGRKALRVNIEAQTKKPKSFSLRQTYYVSRGISSEKSHGVFEKSDYHKLQKFYSIWLMTDPAKSLEGQIEFEYAKKVTFKYPSADISEEDNRESSPYCIATVYLPKGDITATDGDPLNILAVMMRNPAGIKEKEQFLRNNGIVIDTETRGVIDAMCTLEEHFINKGRKEGRKEGRQEAKQETKVEIARKMLNEGLTLDMIKTCTGLTIQMIKEIAASLKRTVASHPSGSLA